MKSPNIKMGIGLFNFGAGELEDIELVTRPSGHPWDLRYHMIAISHHWSQPKK
jgi:hypothetical protein